jgi:tetratricopeptide (TPR) repeat protein
MKIKEIKSLIFVSFVMFASFCTANKDSKLLKQANALYNEQNYEQALQIYLALESKYQNDWRLHYNIGNVYFRLSVFPHSVLYFERAIRLNPSDKALKENLKIVNSHLRGDVFPIPESLLWQWMQDMASYLFPSTWLIIVLLALFLSSAAFCAYYFAENRLKVLTFYVFLFCSLLTLALVSLAITRSITINEDNYAIVFDANGLIPEEDSGEQQFGKQQKIKLYNGEKVKIVEKSDGLYLIQTLDGRRAKVKNGSIQTI